MTERSTLLKQFIGDAGWGMAEIGPLAGDASNRRYLRLRRNGTNAVLMDAPPEKGEDVVPFGAVTNWLRECGLSAPELIAVDTRNGFLLLEDLGDALFSRHLCTNTHEELVLYRAAIDVLLSLADAGVPPSLPFDGPSYALPVYDQMALDREAGLFIEWWLPAVGWDPSADQAAEYVGLVQDLTLEASGAREVVVLRDYHAENLLWLPDRPGTANVGLLDYQDALAGHGAYDLVSLLEDARRDTDTALRSAMVTYYLSRRPGLDEDTFRRTYAVLGAQRNLKIIGIFTRLFKRDGKAQYLDLIPRVWGHLMRDLSHPACDALATWVHRWSPDPTPEVLKTIVRDGGDG